MPTVFLCRRGNRSGVRLAAVPPELLAAHGLNPGVPKACPACSDPSAVATAISSLTVPDRWLDELGMTDIVEALAAGKPLPPVQAYRALDSPTAELLDGYHRLAVARAAGFQAVPVVYVQREDANDYWPAPGGRA